MIPLMSFYYTECFIIFARTYRASYNVVMINFPLMFPTRKIKTEHLLHCNTESDTCMGGGGGGL